MALSLDEKKTVVKQVNMLATKAIAVGVAEYRGLTVAQVTNLRTKALEDKVHLKVVKNTLAKRAIKETDCECVSDLLVGPIVMGFSADDPGAVARVFDTFAKDNEELIVKGLGVAGDAIDVSQLKRIASLPTKDQAISTIMAMLLAPVEKLSKTLNEFPLSITRVVNAVRNIK